MRTFMRFLTIGAVVFAVAAASVLMVGRAVLAFRDAETERTTQQELMTEGIQLVQKAAAAFGKLERENCTLRAEVDRLSVVASENRRKALAWKAYCESQQRQAAREAERLRWFRNAYSDQSERFETRVHLLETFIEENTCLPVPAEPAPPTPTLAPPEVR